MPLIELSGFKIYTDDKDILQLSKYQIHEPTTTKYIKKYVKEGDIAFDVGSHIGYFSLILSNLVGKTGCVHAFEPDKNIFKICEKNKEINKKENIKLHQVGVSNYTSTGLIYLSKDNCADHRTYPTFNDTRETNTIKVISLDSYAEENNILDNVNLIKIDVQGYELNVLNGMRKILESNFDIIIIVEFWPYGLQLNNTTSKQFFDFFIKRGFSHAILDDGNENAYYTINELLDVSQNVDGWYTNLMWKREI